MTASYFATWPIKPHRGRFGINTASRHKIMAWIVTPSKKLSFDKRVLDNDAEKERTTA